MLLPESDIRRRRTSACAPASTPTSCSSSTRPHSALFNNGGAGTLPWLPDHEHCFFDADGPDGPARSGRSSSIWDEHRAAAPAPTAWSCSPPPTTTSPGWPAAPRTAEQLGAAFTFLLTWGSIPSIYYGDEIGMRYLPGLPDHEGSICHPSYNRAGCRTPMQWDERGRTPGSPTAPADRLYLPQRPDPDRPDRRRASSPTRLDRCTSCGG